MWRRPGREQTWYVRGWWRGGGGVLYLQDQPLGDLGICVGVVLVRMLVHHPMR